MASLNCEQTEVHMMPENMWRAQKRSLSGCALNKPGLMKMPGDSGVNSTTEKLFKICSVAEQVSDY